MSKTLKNEEEDITDHIPMIMINCYITIAFVKNFPYQNNKDTVSTEA